MAQRGRSQCLEGPPPGQVERHAIEGVKHSDLATTFARNERFRVRSRNSSLEERRFEPAGPTYDEDALRGATLAGCLLRRPFRHE